MSSSQETIIAIDLGTSTSPVKIVLVTKHEENKQTIRKKISKAQYTEEVSDWPHSSPIPLAYRSRLPTCLIYRLNTCRLAYWGFEAKDIIEVNPERIEQEGLFVVETPKTLLADDDGSAETAVEKRRSERRQDIWQKLRKRPFEVYQDFLDVLLNHALSSRIGGNKRAVFSGFELSRAVNVVIAFPGGWCQTIHAQLAQSTTSAMRKAIRNNKLLHLKFSVQNVWTTSETICGVKEWFQGLSEESNLASDHTAEEKSNFDWMKEEEQFLVLDIGAGTGCSTPLRLDTKEPPRITQLGSTKSLAICGDAVEAEFEAYLQSRRITEEDCPKNLKTTLSKICTWFKDKKKMCGDGSDIETRDWLIPFPHLRANKTKNFKDDFLPIARKVLESCFDSVIEQLLHELQRTLKEFPKIKKIVVLGEFGSASLYLRRRIEQSAFVRANGVKLQYSPFGKMNVVKGALADLMVPHENFARHLVTYRRIDRLITLPWEEHTFAFETWPRPSELGALPFEIEGGKKWLNVIESGIPKGFPIKDQIVDEPGNPCWRSWTTDQEIELEDWLIVSDEEPGFYDRDNKKNYRLFTHNHVNNTLVVNGKKIDVQVVKFYWDLTMAVWYDDNRKPIPCTLEDLEIEYTGKRKKGKLPGKQEITCYKLEYTLAFLVTETQIKVLFRAHFPPPIGRLELVPVSERRWIENDTMGGESRFWSMQNDIDITTSTQSGRVVTEGDEDTAESDHSEEAEELPHDKSDPEFSLSRKSVTRVKSSSRKRKRSKKFIESVASALPKKQSKRRKPSSIVSEHATKAVGIENSRATIEIHASSKRNQKSISASTGPNVKEVASSPQTKNGNNRTCSFCQNEYFSLQMQMQISGVQHSNLQVVCNTCSQWDPFCTENSPTLSSHDQRSASQIQNIAQECLLSESKNRFKPITKGTTLQNSNTIIVGESLVDANSLSTTVQEGFRVESPTSNILTTSSDYDPFGLLAQMRRTGQHVDSSGMSRIVKANGLDFGMREGNIHGS